MKQPASPTIETPATRFPFRTFARVSAAGHLAFFALRFLYTWLDDVVRDERGTLLPRLIEEGTGSLGSFLLSGFVYLAWQRGPLRGERLWSRCPAYLVLGLLLSAANTSFMWASRTALFPLAGLGPYDYGRMPLRYLMEAPSALIGFATMLGALWLADEVIERRVQAVTRVELERALTESQIHSLRLQLQPHFLFNALNTISAQIHEDPRHADRLVGRLADLLRVSSRSSDHATVRVREELDLLDAYVDLMRARFGSRLDLTVHCDPAALECHIPPLLLQPIVENAVRHGGLERTGHASIDVTIRTEPHVLELVVQDDGPGAPADRDPLASGTGLRTTARRLALLYGASARIEARNDVPHGFRVTVSWPRTLA